MAEPVELWATSRRTSLRLLAYDGAGQGGPSAVALHGLTTSIDVLREARPGVDPYGRLAAEGLNVLALDWPGHGRSGGRRGRLTYRLAMEAAGEAALVAADRWGGRVGAFGTALGGVLAFYAALEEPRIEAVACHNVLDLRDVRPVIQRARQGVLLPVAGRLARWTGVGLPTGDSAVEHLRIPASAVVAAGDMAGDPRLARALRSHPQTVKSYDLGSLVSLFLTPEEKPDVAAQTAPTFIAVGGRDRVLPETTTRAFASRLTCPHELWVLPGAGHQLVLEHPRALLPSAAAFLREHLA
jgi:pimeloyl-ACP methyl ester carboxylesterase